MSATNARWCRDGCPSRFRLRPRPSRRPPGPEVALADADVRSHGQSPVPPAGCGGALLFSVHGGNSLLADPASEYMEEVTVVHKERKERRRMHRSGRRMVRGESYTVYFVEVVFADSTRRRIQVPRAVHSACAENRRKRVSMRRGFFGFPVLKRFGAPGVGPRGAARRVIFGPFRPFLLRKHCYGRCHSTDFATATISTLRANGCSTRRSKGAPSWCFRTTTAASSPARTRPKASASRWDSPFFNCARRYGVPTWRCSRPISRSTATCRGG